MKPFWRNALIAGAFLLVLLITVPGLVGLAASQPAQLCGPRDAILTELQTRYKEAPAFSATAGSLMMEVTISPEGTWTMLLIHTDGRACLLAAGHNWTAGQPTKQPGRDT